MSSLALVAHQFRYDQKSFWRNPASVFFTVMFPVLLFVIFAVVFSGQTVDVGGGIDVDTYYVPAIITMAVISATMQSLAMSLTIAREDGRLKRGRGTPMPAWVFIAGRIGNAIVVSVLMLALLAAIGSILFGVEVPWSRLPEVLLTLAVGAACFCCLGVMLTALIPSADAAAPIANFTLLPLYFLSGVFIPEDQLGSGVIGFADAFPVRHFFEAFFSVYLPDGAGGAGMQWGHLGVVAAWGAMGLLLAVRYFRWAPKEG
jgi:ABC-2 type transport system permease protein